MRVTRTTRRRRSWPEWAGWIVIEYSGKVLFHENEPVWCYPGIWISHGRSEEWRRLRRIGFHKARDLQFKIAS